MEDVIYNIYNNLFDSQKELKIKDIEMYTNLENELVIQYKKDKITYIITNTAIYSEK